MGLNSLIETIEKSKAKVEAEKEIEIKASQREQVDADLAQLKAFIGESAYNDLYPYIRAESASKNGAHWQITYSFTAPQLQLVPFNYEPRGYTSQEYNDRWGAFRVLLLKARADYPAYEAKALNELEYGLRGAWTLPAIDSIGAVALRKLPHFSDKIANLQAAARARIAEAERNKAAAERGKSSMLAEYEKQYRAWAECWKVAYKRNADLFKTAQASLNTTMSFYKLTYAAVARERDEDGNYEPWVETTEVYTTDHESDKNGFFNVIERGGAIKRVKYAHIVSVEEMSATPSDYPRVAKVIETPIGSLYAPYYFHSPILNVWADMPERPDIPVGIDRYAVSELQTNIETETGIRELLPRGDF